MIYSFLLTIGFAFLLPVFAYQALVNKKYLSNFRERLGFLPDELSCDARDARDYRSTIWIHAVSVGETIAARPLIKLLRSQYPNYRFIISTTTATGQAIARASIGEADGFCYFPFDWKFSVRRALNIIKPSIVVLMESELWFNFLLECKERKIPTLIVNGRISDRSFKRSLKFRFFMKKLYELPRCFAMQSRADADRAIQLGAAGHSVVVTGNLKYDIGGGGDKAANANGNLLDQRFNLHTTPLIIAGSTLEGEEEIVIEAFKLLVKDSSYTTNFKTRLLIAPRHPERFNEVAEILKRSGISYVRRSSANGDIKAQCILLDSIGELASVYQFASIVFVGGSLEQKRGGGHNILEPALYGKPIVVGPYMDNFRAITTEFLKRNALVQLSANAENISSLYNAFVTMLRDNAFSSELGNNARRAIEDNRGATARTINIIKKLIEE